MGKHVVVVHGVQTGKDADITCADQVRALIRNSLAVSHLEREFTVDGYCYEGVNDDAAGLFKAILDALLNGEPLAAEALKVVVDLVGDVVLAASNGSTAARIRDGLRQRILQAHASGHEVVVVAHSLGTIYALDVIGGLMGDPRYFKGDKATWPARGLVTMGSPLGLRISLLNRITVFEDRPIAPLHDANGRRFPWHNYFNRLDPIVSGNIFGPPVDIDEGARGPVEKRYDALVSSLGWNLRGHVITQGEQWLFAHTAYWKSDRIGDQLLRMLWR